MKYGGNLLVTLQFFLKKYLFFVFILFILFFASKMDINPPLLAVGLLIAYKICFLLLSDKIIDSKVFVAIISMFFYVLVLQSTSLVTWLFSHSFPLSLNIFMSLLVIGAIFYSLNMTHSSTKKRVPFTSGDVASFLVVIATLAIFVILPVMNTRLHNESGLLALANYNVDDGSHLSLLNARLQYNVATTTGNKADTSSQVEGGIAYPTGWPAANAAIIQALDPSIKVGSATLVAYILIKIFWFLFLVFVFARSTFALFNIFSKQRFQLSSFIWISLGCFIFTAWFLTDSFFYGFFSFIPQLITVPLFILTIIQLASIEKKSDNLLSHLMLPTILSVGAALSWFLLFPIFIITLLLCLFNRMMRFDIKTILRELITRPLNYLFFYFIIFLSLFSQLYIVLRSTHKGASSSLISSLLLNGGINIYPVSFYSVILLGIVLFFIFTITKKNTNQINAILNYILVMGTFAAFVYVVQLYKVQHNLYYYFKILDTVTIVGIMVAIVGVAFLINIIQVRSSKYVSIALCLIISLTLLQFGYPNPPLFNYAKGIRAISPSVDKQIFTALKNNEATSNYVDGTVTIFYPSNNPILNEVASTILQASKSYTKCYATIKAASFEVSVKDFTTSPIARGCASNNHIVYYAESASVQHMREIIAKDNLSSKVTVLPIAN